MFMNLTKIFHTLFTLSITTYSLTYSANPFRRQFTIRCCACPLYKVNSCSSGTIIVSARRATPKTSTLIFKTIIKNEETIKKIYNDNLGLNRTIVAINYDEGAAINCVIDAQERGQCETFSLAQDSGKEPLLQIIPFA